MTKELKETVKNEIANIDLFQADAGAGMESVSSDQVIVPRISLLQSMSPCTKKSSGEYLEGAEEGMFLNKITQKLYSGEKGMDVIPLNVRQTLVEFSSREDGGNFLADHSHNLTLWDQTPYDEVKKGKITQQGTRLVKSFEFLVCILEEDGTFSPALLNLSSSQYKKGHKWFSQLRQFQVKNSKGVPFNPAIYYSVYNLKSSTETKDSNSWMGYKITRVCDTVSLDGGMSIYTYCSDFSKSYSKGEIKIQEEAINSDDIDVEELI